MQARPNRVSVFFDDKELALLKAEALATRLSTAEYLRQVFFHAVEHKPLNQPKLLQDEPKKPVKPAPPPLELAPDPVVTRLSLDDARAQKEYERLYAEKVRRGEIEDAPRRTVVGPSALDPKVADLLDQWGD